MHLQGLKSGSHRGTRVNVWGVENQTTSKYEETESQKAPEESAKRGNHKPLCQEVLLRNKDKPKPTPTPGPVPIPPARSARPPPLPLPLLPRQPPLPWFPRIPSLPSPPLPPYYGKPGVRRDAGQGPGVERLRRLARVDRQVWLCTRACPCSARGRPRASGSARGQAHGSRTIS